MSDLDKKTTIDTESGEMEVSTVRLAVPHGPNRDQHYETYVFHEDGSTVTDRYQTESEAIDGHTDTLEALRSGSYTLETSMVMKRLEIHE